MERNIKRNGLVNLLVLAVAAAVTYAISRWAGTEAGQVASAFLAVGVLVAGVSGFQMGLEERERIEKMEFDEAARGSSASLFNTAEAEAFPARRSREQFERFFVPGFTVVLFLLEAAGAWWFWHWLQQLPAAAILDQTPAGLNRTVVTLFVLLLTALVLFILGRYSANLSRLERLRLLTPGGSWLLLGAYLLGLVVAGNIAVLADFPKIDFYLAHLSCAILALLAVENSVSLVLEIYRPRVRGKQERLLYESRLVGLLGHPEDIFATAAHTLDYQFGFKVSETWFYKFLEKAFFWLVLIQVGLLWLSTCFVVVDSGEEALLERFGQPVGDGVIGPGLHLKLPWPMDSVHRYRKLAVQTFDVGVDAAAAEREHNEQAAAGGGHSPEKTVLWSVAHTDEKRMNMLVATREPPGAGRVREGETRPPPVNLLTVRMPVFYQIRDLREWAYNHANPDALLQRVATREVVQFLATADLLEILSTERIEAGEALRRRVQQRADEMKLGVTILFMGFFHTHPPVEVAASYEAVVGAQQQSAAEILKARAHEAETNLLAQAEALRRERVAEAQREQRVSDAVAREAIFTNQIGAYRRAPEVYANRAYLQALADGAAGARKYILATTNTQDVLIMNLEEKILPGILEAPLPVKPGQ